MHSNTNQPICITDAAGDEVKDDGTKLCEADCMYDGAMLASEIRSMWNLSVLHQSGRNLIVSVSAVLYTIYIYTVYSYIYIPL